MAQVAAPFVACVQRAAVPGETSPTESRVTAKQEGGPGRELALVSARVEAHVAAPFVARVRRALVPGAAPPTKSRVAANKEEKGKG